MTQQPSSASGSRPSMAHYAQMPQDARLISLIIASMGVEDIEPGVEMMLLEWANRYIHTILSDSLLYSNHAHPSSSSSSSSTSTAPITLPDLTLAIQSNLSHSLIQQPSKSSLLTLASSLNSNPLPPISDRYGLRLPPREHCLTGVNFGIVPLALEESDDEEDDEDQQEMISRAIRGEGAVVGEEEGTSPAGGQEEDEQDVGDVTMTATDEVEKRGVKRNLEEDEDYD